MCIRDSNNVSYFVGLDADERRPNTILTGDDNFTVGGVKPIPGILSLWTNSPVAWTRGRHVNQGNFAMADGSVLALTTPMLKKARLIQARLPTGSPCRDEH